MMIIGFLLILLAVVVIAYVVLATAGDAAVEVSYGVLNVQITPLWLFLAGVLTLLVAAVGFWMTGVGARRKARQSREMRELRKQAKEADRRAARTGQADVSRPAAPVDRTSGVDRPGTPDRPASTSTTDPRPGSTGGTTGHDSAGTQRNRLEPDR